MTVQKDVTKNIYVGNGSTRTYPFTFECPAEHPEYIKVYLIQEDGTAQVTVDYLLDMDARQITYPSSGAALPDGKKLVIMRELPLQQQMNLVNNGPYFAEDIEQAFDENVMAMQQIAEKLNRTITMSVDVDGSAFINEVPFEAGKSFRIADDGKSIVLTEDPARVLPLAQSKLEAATAQANIAAAKAAAAAESESKAESYSTAADASKTAAAASSSDAANSAAVAAGYKADTLLMKNAVAENVKAAKESEANAKQASVSASASETEAKAAKVAANEAAANASNSASEAKRYESEANSYAENAKEYAATATTKASETTAKVIEATDEANRAKAEADRAKSISDNIGNPVSDVTENNGTVTVTKSNGTQSTFMAFPQDANGTLPIEKGGTGLASSPSMLINLGSTTAANVLQVSPRPGVAGILPIANGGTGATTAAQARETLGLDTLGIPPAPVLNRRIEKSGSVVKLYWREPNDITVDGSKIAGWTKTVVVKKQGAYPETPADGTIVLTNTVRDKYAKTPYIDTQTNASDWYYRAFPYNEGTYSKEASNKFGWYSYAFYIDEDDPVESTCVHPVAGYENYHLTPAHMDFVDDKFFWGGWENAQILPRPCMLKTDGTVDYYLNQDDYTKKENGAASDVTNTSYNGNAMMEFPCIYSKVEHIGSKLYIYIASHKLDSEYECYSCLRNDGTYNEHFYLPIYEGYVLSNKIRSLSSNTKPTGGTTAENEATYAAANGAGWYTTTWADEILMQMLGVLLFGRLNIQIALGYNCGSSSGGLTHNCGSGNAKGMFYGKESTGPTATKYFGMENWYGHRWRRCNGLMLVDYKYKVKLTRHSKDGSTTNEYNRTGSGYIDTGLTCPSANSSYIKTVHGSKYGAFLPKVVTGASNKTYYCDGVWSAGGTTQVLCGGSVYNGELAGLFACLLNLAPSSGNWDCGASLSYHKP